MQQKGVIFSSQKRNETILGQPCLRRPLCCSFCDDLQGIGGNTSDHFCIKLYLKSLSCDEILQRNFTHRQPSRSLASGTSVSQCESTSLPWFLQHLINHHHQDDQFFITIFIMMIRCDFWNSMDVHASTVSTLHLCCISLDRWLLLFPLLHSCSIRTTKNWNHLRLLHECLQVLRHRSAVAVSHGDHTQGIPQEDHSDHHHLTPFS